MGFPGGSDGKESACNAGNPGSIPGLGRSPGEGNGSHSSILVHLLLCAQDDVGSYFSWESFHRLESDIGNVFCRSGAN